MLVKVSYLNPVIISFDCVIKVIPADPLFAMMTVSQFCMELYLGESNARQKARRTE